MSLLADSAPTTTARERLLHGLAASIKTRGYRDTTVADIVGHARTSRRTFYEVFPTKDDCFLALLVDMTQRMQSLITASIDPQAPWDEQVRAGITAWVEAASSEPELSVSWIRELPLLGAPAREAERAGLQSMAQMLMEVAQTPGMQRAGVPPVTMAKATILLGGLRELAAMVAEEGGDMRSIIDPAVEAALALLGPRPADT